MQMQILLLDCDTIELMFSKTSYWKIEAWFLFDERPKLNPLFALLEKTDETGAGWSKQNDLDVRFSLQGSNKAKVSSEVDQIINNILKLGKNGKLLNYEISEAEAPVDLSQV